MENKYYIPSVEEFYPNFEYEILDESVGKFGKISFKDGESAINLIEDCCGEIRVKYLDKEDIEELGFKFKTNSYSGYYSNGEYKISWWWDNKGIEIEEDSVNDFGGRKLFSGQIKNKNELKKLLKQLNIWQN